MRLSTKGRYALEALVLLGHKSQVTEKISLKMICDETHLTVRYLEQLFRDLKKSQIVISKKGKNGGYQLAKPADEISVREILNSVEGSLAPVKCIDNKPCNRADKCITRSVWESIYEEINSVIDNITLKSLIEDYKRNLEDN